MPIYEYRCQKCCEVFEEILKFSDPPLDKCRLCGADNPEKLVSAAAFHLKGSGWYQTDYKKTDKPTSKQPKSDKEAADPAPSEKSSSGEDSTPGPDS